MQTMTTISFSPDGAYFATGSRDNGPDRNIIRIWDAAAGTLVRRISARGSFKILWSPDGAKIATLWSLYGPTEKLSAEFSTHDAHWYIHDVVTGDCLQDIPVQIPSWLLSVATGLWSPDGSHFASQSVSNNDPHPHVYGPIHITAFSAGSCADPFVRSVNVVV